MTRIGCGATRAGVASAVVLLGLGAGSPASAATLEVGPGGSIQAAIEAAENGDLVEVGPGQYEEDLDFLGKSIAVVGAGAGTVLRGSGQGPVVTFAHGEGPDSVLDSFQITGGSAELGGGVFVRGADPTILRNLIVDNEASSRGSGIYLEDSTADVYNNLVAYSRNSGRGDPHGIEIVDASPRIVNNTIVRGDSNGIIVRGASAPLIVNNIISRNGSGRFGARRGRGICDFSEGGAARIHYNLFHRNRIAALLTDRRDFRRVRAAERRIGEPRFVGNRDGHPRFARRRLARRPDRATLPDDFELRDRSRRAVDAGHPDPAYADLDGTRNDLGHTGGPFAAP